MKSEIDVLILFAEEDNKSEGNKIGWVSQFKRFLDLMLTQVLGEKPNILLKGEFDTITSPNLDNTATIIPILSKAFIQSGTCLDNVETFNKKIENGPKKLSRVYKVFKTPLTSQEQPPRLRDFIGYEMYQMDPDSGEIREYTDYFSSEAERQYWMKMVDLAYDIYDTLLQLKGEGSASEPRNIYNRKTVYLAETGHDLSVQRNIIRRELQRHGYNVLPNQNLPGSVHDLERMVTKELDESNLSIHLIGAAYGEIPEGGDRSYLDIQNSLAAAKSLQSRQTNSDEFSRLVWISPNLSNASERQKAFIEKLKRDSESQEGAEILQTPLEDFKNIMREELLDHGSKNSLDDHVGKIVYLVHDRVDKAAIKPLADVMTHSGYKILTPEFEGDLLALRKKHIDNLRNFDVAIIYKGKVNEQWVRMKILDLLKAPGFGRKKPIIGKALIMEEGSKANIDAFKGQDIRVMEGDEQRVTGLLKSFLNEFSD